MKNSMYIFVCISSISGFYSICFFLSGLMLFFICSHRNMHYRLATSDKFRHLIRYTIDYLSCLNISVSRLREIRNCIFFYQTFLLLLDIKCEPMTLTWCGFDIIVCTRSLTQFTSKRFDILSAHLSRLN